MCLLFLCILLFCFVYTNSGEVFNSNTVTESAYYVMGKKVYNGNIKENKITITTNEQVHWKQLLIWYVGWVVSFIPVFTDVLVYLAKNDKLTLNYWISRCIHGDILWIIATIVILSVIDHLTDDKEQNTGMLIAGLILLVFVAIVWAIFKYLYPPTYTHLFPFVITCIAFVLSLVICTFLQI